MVDQNTVELVAAAIDSADVGFQMNLTRLVDGVYTYELRIDGKVEEFDNTDEVYIRVREIKQRKQAEAVIAALAPPDRFRDFCDQLISMFDFNKLEHSVCDEDMELVEHIRAALASTSEAQG